MTSDLQPPQPNIPGGSRYERLLKKIDEQGDSDAPTPTPETEHPRPSAAAQGRPPLREQQVPQNVQPARESRLTKANMTRVKRVMWQGKPWEAFQTTVILLSFFTNLVLIVIVLTLGSYLFTIKQVIAEPLIGGLYTSFGQMDDATIRRVIPVNDEILVEFDLPIDQNITVILTADVPLRGLPTVVNLGGGNQLTGTVDIVLREGTPLPIQLTMLVPVTAVVPINIDVEAVIPLNETELHEPFANFQILFAPYNDLIEELPDSWEDVFARAFNRR